MSTEWLEEHLGEGMVILDCQPDIHDHILEHIPGAVYMNEQFFRLSSNGMPGEYMSPEAIQLYLRRLGVRNDAPVVVATGRGEFKGWGDGLEQTNVAYSLTRYGANRVLVLDGGLDRWKEEGRPLTKGFPRGEERYAPSDFLATVRSEYFVEYQEFKGIKDKEDTILLDARPTVFYEKQGPWGKPGHIPGAVSLPWKDLMMPENTRKLRPDGEIREILASKGIDREHLIICSCGTGREATNEFLLFRWYLGFPRVKIYEGSFLEWSSYPDNPTVVGKEPY